jgi:hypothetical protein
MRQSSWLSFLVFTILALALTACAGPDASELSFEPALLEAEDGGFGEAAAVAQAAKDNLSLADLVVELDGAADRSLAVSADGCTYGLGYWKNHTQAWEDTTLALGGTEYSANQLLSILNTPPRGDATYILAQQLIAAKLNGAATEAELVGYIAEADAWLRANTLDSAPADEARQQGILLAELLNDYNNGLLGEACDEDDEDADVDDDDRDDDDGDRLVSEDGECTGANPHPHATTLAANYGVSYEEIMARFCQGYGFGEIELAYLLAEEAGISVEEVYALRDAGMGWGNIRKHLGAAPGLGNDKPKGNDNAPPGQEEKGEDWAPPGQEKKGEDWAPPGQSNQNPNANSSPGKGNGKNK